MKRLTIDDIQDRLYPVLMRYTPAVLKDMPRDRLTRELAEALAHCDVLSFTLPGAPPRAGTEALEQSALKARARLNAEALEAAARAAVLAILAVVEVRQR